MYRAVFTLAIVAVSTVVRADYSVEKSEDKPPEEVDAALVEVLSKTSYAVKDGDTAVLHVWIRDEIPSTSTGLALPGYDTVPEGTLIGIYQILNGSFTDFRGQELPVGVYTMRIAQHPQDGNHMGVAPTQQFLVLVPAKMDKGVDPIEIKELLDKSKETAGTGHPAALYVEPFFDTPEGEIPAIRKNDLEHTVLDVSTMARTDSTSAAFPWAIVFVGKTDAE